MKHRKLTASLVILIGSIAAFVQAEPLTFEQAWQQILIENDGLKAEKSNAERFQNLATAGRALNLPNIEIVGSYARVDNPPGISERVPALLSNSVSREILADLVAVYPELADSSATRTVKSAGVNALWIIYSGGRISAAQESLLADANQAERLYDIKKLQTFSDLVRFYYGVVLAKDIYSTRLQVEKTSFIHLENAKKLELHGQIPKIERLSAQVSYDSAKVDAENARRELEIAQVVLDKLLYLENAEPSSNLLPIKPLPPLENFLQTTLSQHPALAIFEQKKIQAENLLQAEYARYLPTVAAVGKYNLYKQRTLLDDQKPEWVLGINVSIPLLDTSGRKHRVAAAHNAKNEVGYRQADLIHQLNIAVEQNYRRVMQARAQYESLLSSEAQAQENFHLRSKAFEQGLGTSTEVTDAQVALVAIQTQRQAAKYQMTIALAGLLTLNGEFENLNQYQEHEESRK